MNKFAQKIQEEINVLDKEIEFLESKKRQFEISKQLKSHVKQTRNT